MSSPTGVFVIGLPIADRRRTMAFYRDAFGFEPIGAPAEDGVPEPLQYPIGEQTRLMFVPTGGFGWALGDRGIAPSGTSECLLNTTVVTERDVTDLAARAGRAGRRGDQRTRAPTVGIRGDPRRPRRARLADHRRVARGLLTGRRPTGRLRCGGRARHRAGPPGTGTSSARPVPRPWTGEPCRQAGRARPSPRRAARSAGSGGGRRRRSRRCRACGPVPCDHGARELSSRRAAEAHDVLATAARAVGRCRGTPADTIRIGVLGPPALDGAGPARVGTQALHEWIGLESTPERAALLAAIPAEV